MLHISTYFIREHIGFMKMTDTYDIIDPRTQEQVGIAKEKLPLILKVLRLWLGKALIPSNIHVYSGTDFEDDGKLVFSIRRGIALFKPRVDIRDANGTHLGHLIKKAFSIGGAFYVFDAQDQQVAMVKGNWIGREFKILDSQEREIGQVTKKWSGIGKEMFTSADNYVIDLGPDPHPGKAILFLAAGLAIDSVLKEKK